MQAGELRSPRVLHVVQTLVAGGAETAVRTLCAGLAREGVEAGVVSVYPSGLSAHERAALAAPVVDLARRGRGDLAYFGPLVAALRRLRPDVVHAHLHTGQYAGRVAALLAAAPAIALTVHGKEPGGPLRWALDRVLHARTARFIVFSEGQKRSYAAEQRVPLERIAVIPNGIAAATPLASRAEIRARLGLPQDAFMLYAAARLAPEKNLRCALDAMARALASGAHDMHFAIAGTGPLEAELRARACALGLRERVHFLGFRPDAAALAHAMDLFVMPSRRERMPLALGEAMLGGLVPALTPWEGHAELVCDGRTGLVAAGDDAAAFARVLLRAHDDPAGLRAIGEAARAAAARAFDPAAMVRAHADLYRTLSRRAA